MPYPYDPSKPTIILSNSMTTNTELYKAQFANPALTSKMNLLAVDLLGHGKTKTKSENFTYWDSAIMNLQVMSALNISKAFALGTSQGGWITVRMALLAPDRIEGIIPLGTSMDYESERTRKLGCWDGPSGLTPCIDAWTTNEATPDFEPSSEYCNLVMDTGFGTNCEEHVRKFWTETIKKTYKGDEGRKNIRMAAINLSERDGLHGRLPDVKCPVMWMHGTDDVVYSLSNAKEEIKLFTNSKDAKLVAVEGGQHFLSASNPAVSPALQSYAIFEFRN